MNINNNRAKKEICNYIISKYTKISVKPGKGLFNYQCHRNSVHIASRNKHKKIAMCVYIDEGYPIVHFINYNKGKYTDNTLGEWTTLYEYYFIKWIKEDEFYNVFTIFDAFKKELGKRLSWWVKLTSNWRG